MIFDPFCKTGSKEQMTGERNRTKGMLKLLLFFSWDHTFLSTFSIEHPFQVKLSSPFDPIQMGGAGVSMEVMDLVIGEFVDEYTVCVVDVFAMPQSDTSVSVEVVDHVFQTNMLNELNNSLSIWRLDVFCLQG